MSVRSPARAWRSVVIGTVALSGVWAAALPAGAAVVEQFAEPYEFTASFECDDVSFDEHVVGEVTVSVRMRGSAGPVFEQVRDRSTSIVTNTETGRSFTTTFRSLGVDNRVLGVEGDVYTVASSFTYHYWIYDKDGRAAARNDGHTVFVYEFDASTGEWEFVGQGAPIVGRQDTLDVETDVCPLAIELTTG